MLEPLFKIVICKELFLLYECGYLVEYFGNEDGTLRGDLDNMALTKVEKILGTETMETKILQEV